ncbi:MAG: DHHW family protein [Clostridia bacterium]
MKKLQIAFISIFFAITTVFFVGYFIIPDKEFSDDENRELSQLPTFSINNLIKNKYTTKFETYIADQFMFRSFWMSTKTNIQTALMYKDINGTYIGKDDYFIQKLPKNDKVSDTFINNIETLSKKYPNMNLKTAIIPGAATVLSDKLPSTANPFDEVAVFDKFKTTFGDNNVDVNSALSKRKDEYIYFKTDHHWTELGAYYGYEEIAKSLGITPLPLSDFEDVMGSDNFYGTMYSKGCFSFATPDTVEMFRYKKPLDIKVTIPETKTVRDDLFFTENLEKKDKYTVFLGENRKLITIDTNVNNGKTLTILKDSYANALIPFLAPHYEKINVVDLRFFTDKLSSITNTNENQDLLILYSTLSVISDKNMADAFLKI